MKEATVKEPIPHGHGIEIIELVKQDLIDRSEMGKLKYGEKLKPQNGRNALIDAYQEALDLCMYLKQAIYENEQSGTNTKALYDELIMSVGMCFKNETRHQTALRYIKQAEERENDAEKSFGILNQESKK